MKSGFYRILALAIGLSFASVGCGGGGFPGPTGTGGTTGPTIAGGNPAAPPAPPAELPSALRIPESVGIDVETTRTAASGSGALTLDGAAALVGPGKFSEEIIFGSNLVYFANQELDALLGPLHNIKIPVSPSLTELDAFLAIGSKAYVVHLNFRDHDQDGDGILEGCSGHTAALPVCMQIWIEDETKTQRRILEARFDAFPSDINPGAGSLRGMDFDFGSLIQVAADYDHVDPENKFTDVFFGTVDESNPSAPTVPFGIHAFVSQLGPDASAEKLINASSNDGRAIGRWIEGEDYWSGSFFGGSGDPDNFTDQCVFLPSGDGVDGGFCEGIAVGDLDFVPFTTPEDLIFYDFPPTAP